MFSSLTRFKKKKKKKKKKKEKKSFFKFETRKMTVSVLKQEPNTEKVQENANKER